MGEPLSAMQKLEALRSWIDDGSVAAGRRRDEFGDALQAAIGGAGQYQQAFDGLESLTDALDLVDVEPDALRAMAKRLYRAGKHLEKIDSPEAIRLWTHHLCPEAVSEVGRLETTLHKAWKKRLDVMFGPHAALGDVLRRFERTRDLGRRMFETAGAARGLASAWPPNAKTRRTLAQYCGDRETQNAELASAGAAHGVARFLLAVTSGEATLTDLTTEVWEWLREQRALDLFQLSLRTSR